jgi:hypothetical protein
MKPRPPLLILGERLCRWADICPSSREISTAA